MVQYRYSHKWKILVPVFSLPITGKFKVIYTFIMSQCFLFTSGEIYQFIHWLAINKKKPRFVTSYRRSRYKSQKLNVQDKDERELVLLATVSAASFAHAPTTTNRIRRMRINILRNLAFLFSSMSLALYLLSCQLAFTTNGGKKY